MNEPEPRVASNLDDAWANFDPDLPLPYGSPFFVEQSPEPLGRLRRELLRSRSANQKHFLAGFKGAGKSTQIKQLAGSSDLRSKYFVVDFSIRDTSDERNIDYVDLLVAIGSQLFISFNQAGGSLDQGIYDELQRWGRAVEERIKQRQVEAGAIVEAGVGAGLEWVVSFFTKLTAKIRTEFSSRTVIREVLEPQLTDLLDKINLIADGIRASAKKEVLVFVDDTDKPLPEQTTLLFRDHLSPLLQPNLDIVYTVPAWLHFSNGFPEIRPPKSIFLPNVKLYDRESPGTLDALGKATMTDFVGKRMSRDLIDPDALTKAIRMGGGVFREAARVMHMAIDHALEQESPKVTLENVRKATEDLRQDYRRMITSLSQDELETLRNIKESRQYRPGERVDELLNNLLVLEYVNSDNSENWPDVNPILRDVLD